MKRILCAILCAFVGVTSAHAASPDVNAAFAARLLSHLPPIDGSASLQDKINYLRHAIQNLGNYDERTPAPDVQLAIDNMMNEIQSKADLGTLDIMDIYGIEVIWQGRPSANGTYGAEIRAWSPTTETHNNEMWFKALHEPRADIVIELTVGQDLTYDGIHVMDPTNFYWSWKHEVGHLMTDLNCWNGNDDFAFSVYGNGNTDDVLDLVREFWANFVASGDVDLAVSLTGWQHQLWPEINRLIPTGTSTSDVISLLQSLQNMVHGPEIPGPDLDEPFAFLEDEQAQSGRFPAIPPSALSDSVRADLQAALDLALDGGVIPGQVSAAGDSGLFIGLALPGGILIGGGENDPLGSWTSFNQEYAASQLTGGDVLGQDASVLLSDGTLSLFGIDRSTVDLVSAQLTLAAHGIGDSLIPGESGAGDGTPSWYYASSTFGQIGDSLALPGDPLLGVAAFGAGAQVPWLFASQAAGIDPVQFAQDQIAGDPFAGAGVGQILSAFDSISDRSPIVSTGSVGIMDTLANLEPQLSLSDGSDTASLARLTLAGPSPLDLSDLPQGALVPSIFADQSPYLFGTTSALSFDGAAAAAARTMLGITNLSSVFDSYSGTNQIILQQGPADPTALGWGTDDSPPTDDDLFGSFVDEGWD